MKNRKPEILAPAGSVSGLQAVIAAGCDAVYIGGNRFGARAYAENPETDELVEAITFCHLHQVRIYLTVNTLLKDRELEGQLYEYILPYYEAGLDAVIVQDVGVLRFISRYFPDLAVHASTQMALTMGQPVRELEKYHVRRVVPARELSLPELQQLRRDTDAEIEVFVHGALCYCYSGQCLFSSMLGGRSGNRGRCAQPCRMPYQLQQKSTVGEYLLSPRELSALPYLGELVEAGVDSFKIEGRMKRPEYAAFITAVFRKYRDLYQELGKEGYRLYQKTHEKEWQEDLRKMAELYNRGGFTQGYLEGNAGFIGKRRPGERGSMLSALRPKHGGVCVGKVLSADRQQVVYRAEKELSAQDIVEFRNTRMETEYEYTLGAPVKRGQKVTARYQRGCHIAKGDFVYRTRDAALLEHIRERCRELPLQAAVKGTFYAEAGKPMRLCVLLAEQDEICIEVSGALCQIAEKQPVPQSAARRILSQTGNSLFFFQELELSMEETLFLPTGALKALRRNAFAALKQAVREKYGRKVQKPKPQAARKLKPQNICKSEPQTIRRMAENTTHDKTAVFSASVMTPGQLEMVLQETSIQRVYLQTECLDEEQLRQGVQRIRDAGKLPWLVMPGVFRLPVRKLFEQEYFGDNRLFSLGWEGVLVKNTESLSFLQDVVKLEASRIRLDAMLYVMNAEAVRFWQERGIDQYTLPLEETEAEMAALPGLDRAELILYGRLPLMISAQCVRANTDCCVCGLPEERQKRIVLTDRRGAEYHVVNYCKYCYNMIYQKAPLDLRRLVQQKESFAGTDKRYQFTTESPEEVKRILEGCAVQDAHTGHFERGVE